MKKQSTIDRLINANERWATRTSDLLGDAVRLLSYYGLIYLPGMTLIYLLYKGETIVRSFFR